MRRRAPCVKVAVGQTVHVSVPAANINTNVDLKT